MFSKKLFNVLLFFLFLGCQPDKNQEPESSLNLTFRLKQNSIPYSFNQVFKTDEGYRILVNTLKFYLSQIHLHQSNGDSAIIQNIALIDFGNAERQNIKTNPNPSSYTAISLSIGVPKNLNGTSNPNFDPSIYSGNDPLNLINNMYWTWNTGYIFFKIEGKIDTSGIENTPLNNNWFYHIGLDTLYTYKKWDINFVYAEKTTKTIVFTIDLNLFLNGNNTNPIDIKAQPFSHTTDQFALAQKAIQNFVNALTISIE